MEAITKLLSITIYQTSNGYVMDIMDKKDNYKRVRSFYGQKCKEVVNTLKKLDFIEGSYEIL